MKFFSNAHHLIKPIFAALLAATTTPALSANLIVTITDVEQSSGKLLLAVYNSEETFNTGTRLTGDRVTAKSGDMEFIFKDLPVGKYSVMVFHDLNNNDKLDTNLLGMPTEPWGSSLQNPIFGAPGWKDTRFDLREDVQSLVITLN